VIFVPGTKVEDQIAIETEVIYGRPISRTANLYSKGTFVNNLTIHLSIEEHFVGSLCNSTRREIHFG
jgi:hypothetical protein